jgi:hypothetical protein
MFMTHRLTSRAEGSVHSHAARQTAGCAPGAVPALAGA